MRLPFPKDGGVERGECTLHDASPIFEILNYFLGKYDIKDTYLGEDKESLLLS